MAGWQIALFILGLAVVSVVLSEVRYRYAKRRLIRVLRKHGPLRGLQLVQQHGFRRGAIYVQLLRLEDEGIVERFWVKTGNDREHFRLKEKT
jgi:predicted ArsR family transcriptional regulator